MFDTATGFDHDIVVGVAAHLNRTPGVEADAREFTPGKWQVRVTAADPTGSQIWFTAPSENADGARTWALWRVGSDQARGRYLDLRLDHNEPIDAVAATVAEAITRSPR